MKKKLVMAMLAAMLAATAVTGCSFSIGPDGVQVGSGDEAGKDDKEDEEDEDDEKDEEKEEKDDGDVNDRTDKKGEKDTSGREDEDDEKDDSEAEDKAGNADDDKDDEKDSDSDASGITADWTKYEFVIDGKTLSLPCDYQDLKDAGFSMKSSDEKSYLEGGYYTNVNLYNEDDDISLYAEISNLTDEDQQYTDCKVTSVSQTEYMVNSKDAPEITFPGGLVAGMEMTGEELEDLFGEPQDVFEYGSEDDDYWSNTYTWSEDEDYTSFDNIEVCITNGIIDQITMEHTEY